MESCAGTTIAWIRRDDVRPTRSVKPCVHNAKEAGARTQRVSTNDIVAKRRWAREGRREDAPGRLVATSLGATGRTCNSAGKQHHYGWPSLAAIVVDFARLLLLRGAME